MPLTTTGISVQILSSLNALRLYPTQCTINDCKVVVNHLIRKFSEPYGTPVKQSYTVIRGAGGNTVRDHAVPVIVLVDQLLAWNDSQLEVNSTNITTLISFLIQSLLIVEITQDEDLILSQKGFQRAMPPAWSNPTNPLYRNPLARYVVSGIAV